MQLWLLACTAVFSGTLATKIDIGANEGAIKDELVSCLLSAMNTICPRCKNTVNLRIPPVPSSGVDSLAKTLSNFRWIHGVTIDFGDGPSIKDTSPDVTELRIYPISAKADLIWLAHNFSPEKHGVHQIFLLNYDVGPHLQEDLEDVLPPTWYGCKVWSFIFMASFEDEILAYGKAPLAFSPCTHRSLTKFGLCASKNPERHVSRLTGNTYLFRNSSITVIVVPGMKPYTVEHTDNPGGIIGNFMDVVKELYNITVKYDWPPIDDVASGKLVAEDGQKIIFDMRPVPWHHSDLSASIFLTMDEVRWILVSLENEQESHWKGLGGENLHWHLVSFVIFSTVTAFAVADPDKIKLVVRFFGMFLGIAVAWFPKQALGRFLVLLWCLTSYVTIQTFLAGLMTNLLRSSSFHPISDMSNVAENEIDVYCLPSVREYYCRFNDTASIYLCEKCQMRDHNFLRRFNNAVDNKSTSWRPFVYTTSLAVLRANPAHDHSYSLNDYVGLWPIVVYTHRYAVDHTQIIVNHNYRRLTETGIIQCWMYSLESKPKGDSNFWRRSIGSVHWKMVYTILYFGYTLSCVVFLIEILVHKYWKN